MSAATITFPQKATGDKLFAPEVNALKSAANEHAQELDVLNAQAFADVYPSQSKRTQVVSLFTSGSQLTAADVALAGDTADYFFTEFYDFAGNYWYKCLPNPTQPDGQNNASPWWVRFKNHV